MTGPWRDNENSPLPEITDDLVMWRRIPPEKVVYDDNQKRKRPTSDQFKDNINGTHMSVWDAKRSGGVEKVLEGYEHFYLASVTAAQLRESGMTIVRTEKDGVGHCEVIGPKTKSIRSDWAKSSQWVVGPPNEVQR
jgi:hypothetical protein